MANAHADTHHDDSHGQDVYFVPHGSKWPVVGSVALFITMVGVASWLNEASLGQDRCSSSAWPACWRSCSSGSAT